MMNGHTWSLVVTSVALAHAVSPIVTLRLCYVKLGWVRLLGNVGLLGYGWSRLVTFGLCVTIIKLDK
jgi:hypothetical protein